MAKAGGEAPHPHGRGLEVADEETKERVAKAGGEAPHPHGRGLQTADEETRERVARAGGEAPHEKRGLQAADEETKRRVASEGGKASHKNDDQEELELELEQPPRAGPPTGNGDGIRPHPFLLPLLLKPLPLLPLILF